MSPRLSSLGEHLPAKGTGDVLSRPMASGDIGTKKGLKSVFRKEMASHLQNQALSIEGLTSDAQGMRVHGVYVVKTEKPLGIYATILLPNLYALGQDFEQPQYHATEHGVGHRRLIDGVGKRWTAV